jgi:hypothetical protein
MMITITMDDRRNAEQLGIKKDTPSFVRRVFLFERRKRIGLLRDALVGVFPEPEKPAMILQLAMTARRIVTRSGCECRMSPWLRGRP